MTFKEKAIKILKQWQIILLIVCLFIGFLTISPQFGNQGIIINSIENNSSASIAGMQNPSSELSPTKRERILFVDNTPIKSQEEFYNQLDAIRINETLRIKTDKKEYVLWKTSEDLGIIVAEAPKSNLKKGLELQGGTRVLLKPVTKVTNDELKQMIDTMSERLNVYGLTDLTIKSASDLNRDKYIVVEIAGASQEEVRELIAKQGKFEAKIGEEIVFNGGKNDIPYVCKNDGSCSRISTCQAIQEGYYCRFEFEITLSENAAEKHAQVTKNLSINLSSSGSRILSSTIDFYLDDKQVDSLQIDAGLKGQKATRITISGPGYGKTLKEAQQNALNNQKKLQIILQSGSLPTQLEIVKLDSISPSLGKTFIKNTALIGLLGVLVVGIIIFIRYRKIKIVVPIMLTVLCEVYLILGLAALFKNNLDVAAIAGILASVGTGVNDQIVITDEILLGTKGDSSETNIKSKIKKAFFVILAAYAVIMAAMLPLLKASAGLLVGFAFMTIAGVTVGVLITRPAFGAAIRILFEEN